MCNGVNISITLINSSNPISISTDHIHVAWRSTILILLISSSLLFKTLPFIQENFKFILFPYVQDVLTLPQQTRHGPSLVNEVP